MDMRRPNTTSLDLPPALEQLLNMPGGSGMPAQPSALNQAAPMQQPPMQQPPMQQPPMQQPPMQPEMPSYADGGMVGMQGQPVPTGLAPSNAAGMPVDMQGPTPMGSSMAPTTGAMAGQAQDEVPTEADIQQFIQQNPQAIQQLAQEMQALIQSGEVNPQQLQMAEQLATVALNNPEMFPQMRDFAQRQGLALGEDLPTQYDPGFLVTVIVAARSLKEAGGQGTGAGAMQQPPMQQGQSPMQQEQPVANMADGGIVTAGDNASEGGKVRGPGTTTSDSIPIRVSKGEYVIPAHIVQMKGKEFFDSMLEKYKDAR